jgi:hypothetical protein
MAAIVLQILSPMPLTQREDGRTVLSLWKRHLPHLLPDKFNNWEPVNRPFDPDDLENVLDAWSRPFLARKRSPKVDSSVWMRKGTQPLHALWEFSIADGAASQQQLVEFLASASTALKADFSCLHLLTPTELERGRKSGVCLNLDKKATKFFFSISSKELQQRIPDLFWVTVLGGPYVEMFGRDRLLSSPVYCTKSLPSEAVMLQMTENLADVEQHAVLFDETRSSTKSHLGEDAFFQQGIDPSYKYRAPEFVFP